MKDYIIDCEDKSFSKYLYTAYMKQIQHIKYAKVNDLYKYNKLQNLKNNFEQDEFAQLRISDGLKKIILKQLEANIQFYKEKIRKTNKLKTTFDKVINKLLYGQQNTK